MKEAREILKNIVVAEAEDIAAKIAEKMNDRLKQFKETAAKYGNHIVRMEIENSNVVFYFDTLKDVKGYWNYLSFVLAQNNIGEYDRNGMIIGTSQDGTPTITKII